MRKREQEQPEHEGSQAALEPAGWASLRIQVERSEVHEMSSQIEAKDPEGIDPFQEGGEESSGNQSAASCQRCRQADLWKTQAKRIED